MTITVEELKRKIFDCEIDIEKTLRTMRRAIIKAELDIEEAFKSKDPSRTGTVPFPVWIKILKAYNVEVKPVEIEAIFKNFSDNSETELDYV